jgi:hypothetical protein
MSCRECYFIGMRVNEIDNLIEEIKETLKEDMERLEGYDVKIYKNVYGCCGVGGIGLLIEVTGPQEGEIKAIDLKITSKIIESCEKENLEYHILEPLEIM